MANNIWELIPTDHLVEVLRRLPPSARRRSRLVCRLWRDTVDTHTKEMHSRPKTLVATTKSVYLVDNDNTTARSLVGDIYQGPRMSLIGSFNGLVCLCDNTIPGGAITLDNPATGETLPIPPPPLPYTVVSSYWQRTYCFAYHPTTGRYKVLHLQCDFNRVWVFPLGDASWRDIPATASHPDARSNPDPGIVSIDGAVYWFVQARGLPTMMLIMKLDLDDERITCIRPIHSLPQGPNCWNLVAVGMKLGIVITNSSPVLGKTEVWVMDAATTLRWSCRYVVQIHKPPQNPFSRHYEHYLTWPLFSHDGKHILTMARSRATLSGLVMYKHKLRNVSWKAWRGVVEIDETNPGTVVATIETNNFPCRTFAYVETTEPLSVYRCW